MLSEVDQLQREQKWAEALIAVRRADAVLSSGEPDAATAQHVRERLKDLEFVDGLEQIRIQQAAAWPGGKFDYDGVDRAYATMFRDYGTDVESLPVEHSIERLKVLSIAVPVAAALDAWAMAHAKRDAAGEKQLVDIARRIDPDPVRDRLRSTWRMPPSKAREELSRLAQSIDIRAHDPATLVRLAQRLEQVERADLAARLRRDAQIVYPGDFWLNFRLADQLYRTDPEGAARFYTAAAAIRPNMACARNNLGLALSRQKKWDEAIAAFRTAIEIDPKSAAAYHNLGLGLKGQDKFDEAVAAYRKALEIDPDFLLAHVSLAWLLSTCSDLKIRDPSLALTHAKKATELSPSALNLNNLGVAYYRTRDCKAAVAALEKSIELRKDGYTDGLFFLAMSHWQLGNKDEARGWYDKATKKMEKRIFAFWDATGDDELVRIRAEASELLRVNESKGSAPPSVLTK
jgi:tetratricopeptide (TPR) repeat protein